MTRRFVVALGLLAILSGCGDVPLGRGVPGCEEGSQSLILSIQAIPDTEYVPCINGLPIGWDYQDLYAETGSSVFWLDSDRVGFRFLEVALEESCDTGAAEQVTTDEAEFGVPLLVDVEEQFTVTVTVIPEGRSAETSTYANQVVQELSSEDEIEGRELVVQTDARNTPTADRIEQALAAGDVVVVVSVRDAEEETMTVILPNTRAEHPDLSLDDAFELIEDNVDPPSYRGNWYYIFEGGCVTYTFDAEGAGVETIEADVKAALGLSNAEDFRQAGRDAGFEIP